MSAAPSPSPAQTASTPPMPRRKSDVIRLVHSDDGTDVRAFLPAALEVMETPPNPLGRRIALALCGVAFAAIGWATIGSVDIVAVAGGKFVSKVRTQVVQPFETASVKAVLVKAGQTVKAGAPLIEFDRTAAEAERQHARDDLTAAELDQMRLAAFLDGSATAPFNTVEKASLLQRNRAQSQLTAQIAQRASQLASLSQQKFEKLAERQVLTQTIAKLEKTLPLIAERSKIRTKAADLGSSSVPAKLESQQLLIESEAELEITRSKIASTDAALEGLDQKIAATEAEFRTTALADLGKAQERVRAGQEALVKAMRRLELETVRAPIDGTVQQLHVTGAGTVVTPAQQLLTIVPAEEGVEIEAVLDNRDVGFVEVGQRVEIKVDAFPFTRYGLIEGTIASIDRDAEAGPVNQSPVQGSVRPADETDRVEGSERLRYMVRIALKQNTLDIDGKPAHFLPGMSVKAEILTGKRRIIDFILAPLREHMHDALRER